MLCIFGPVGPFMHPDHIFLYSAGNTLPGETYITVTPVQSPYTSAAILFCDITKPEENVISNIVYSLHLKTAMFKDLHATTVHCGIG